MDFLQLHYITAVGVVDFRIVVLSIFHNLCYITVWLFKILLTMTHSQIFMLAPGKNLARPISFLLPLALTFASGSR